MSLLLSINEIMHGSLQDLEDKAFFIDIDFYYKMYLVRNVNLHKGHGLS